MKLKIEIEITREMYDDILNEYKSMYEYRKLMRDRIPESDAEVEMRKKTLLTHDILKIISSGKIIDTQKD